MEYIVSFLFVLVLKSQHLFLLKFLKLSLKTTCLWVSPKMFLIKSNDFFKLLDYGNKCVMRCHIYTGHSLSNPDTISLNTVIHSLSIWIFWTFSSSHKTAIYLGQVKKKGNLLNTLPRSSTWESTAVFLPTEAKVYLISLFGVTWWVLVVYFDG